MPERGPSVNLKLPAPCWKVYPGVGDCLDCSTRGQTLLNSVQKSWVQSVDIAGGSGGSSKECRKMRYRKLKIDTWFSLWHNLPL